MEPAEALSTAAQIAVALAGFAGVVVAFRSGPLHEWSPLDKYRLWLLLGNALVPLFACLFGILLLSIKPEPLSTWRACSGFSFALMIAFSIASRRQQVLVGPTLRRALGSYRFFYYSLAVVGTAVGLLQLYNLFAAGVFWFFFAAVLYQLALGALQFARMVLLPPQIHTSGEKPI